MRAIQRSTAHSVRIGAANTTVIHCATPSRKASSAVAQEDTASSRREPDEQDSGQRDEHVQRSHDEILSKAIAVSAIEELQASNRLLRDELRANQIGIPKAASVLETSSRRHLETAVTDSKLLRMRQNVNELLRVARHDDDGDVLEAYCDKNCEELKRIMEGGSPDR